MIGKEVLFEKMEIKKTKYSRVSCLRRNRFSLDKKAKR